MSARTVTLAQLSKPVRAFLTQARRGRGLVVEDRTGRGWVGVFPYEESSTRAQTVALQRMARLQRKVGRVMQRRGKTEAEFDRLLRDA